MDDSYKAPLLTEFHHVVDHENHNDIPESWYMVVTDVVNSTIAVNNGRYKDVNVIGASTIIAVLNAVPGVEIPFIFGGDGASFLFSPQIKDKATKALVASAQMAEANYGLELRVGIVPVKDLYEKGYSVKLAHYQMSDHLTQAAFSGNGIAVAEDWVKSKDPHNPYLVPTTTENYSSEIFKGLECRWKPVASQHGKYVSIIVVCNHDSSDKERALFDRVVARVNEIFFPAGHKVAPYAPNQLGLSRSFSSYANEAKVRTAGEGFWARIMYQLKTYLLTTIVPIFWSISGNEDWIRYQREFIENSDFRKFDGALRMVVDGTENQIKALESYLKSEWQQGHICYGLHLSKHALITCMIFDKSEGRHLHLVDGGDGGYTAASKQLKAQLASLK